MNIKDGLAGNECKLTKINVLSYFHLKIDPTVGTLLNQPFTFSAYLSERNVRNSCTYPEMELMYVSRNVPGSSRNAILDEFHPHMSWFCLTSFSKHQTLPILILTLQWIKLFLSTEHRWDLILRPTFQISGQLDASIVQTIFTFFLFFLLLKTTREKENLLTVHLIYNRQFVSGKTLNSISFLNKLSCQF